MVELSLNSVVGLSTPRTMKLKSMVWHKGVTILVDCGATYNFISLGQVQQLKLPTTATMNYGVIIGFDESVEGKEICKMIVVEMQGLTVVENFLPLELGSTNAGLEMQWLESLGPMEVNWKCLTMKFQMGESVKVLKGDPRLNKIGVSLKAM